MGDLEVGRLEKSMNKVVIGTVTNLRKAEKDRYDDGLQEREEQFQIAVSGVAEEFFAWETVQVRFGTAFVDATGNRDSELTEPHMTYGAKIDTEDPVGLLATVMSWVTNDRGEVIGATVAIGIAATDTATKFKGALHVTFQGFGQPLLTFGEEADVGDDQE